MATITIYDSTVAARTRTADHILTTPSLLAGYEGRGGLADDLVKIREHGRTAETLSLAQSIAQASGTVATFHVLEGFASVQKDYKAVMAVVQAARNDLVDAKAPVEVIKTVDQILINEAEVMIRTVTDEDGSTKKRAGHRVSQEALRGEIARDAQALLDLPVIHPVLAKRKVDKARLAKLRADAEGLAGKLAERAAVKGSGKQATAAMKDAVKEQKRVWGAVYRILAAVGLEDPRVGEMLREAARARAPRKGKGKAKAPK